MSEVCKCDSGKSLNNCCLAVIKGSRVAETAAELMRARYTAFALGEIDFIMDSIAPAKRADYERKKIEKWSKSTDWQGLEIVSTHEGESGDTKGTVEFVAFYREKDAKKRHHEKAEFIKSEGKWYFEDGKAAEVEQVRRDAPKIGRNDPCHCGSGKKFKKCHGQTE